MNKLSRYALTLGLLTAILFAAPIRAQNATVNIVVALQAHDAAHRDSGVQFNGNASIGVLFWIGFDDAVIQAQSVVPGTGVSFRLMADLNRNLAYMLVLSSSYPPFAAYMLGRAEAFESVADWMGEPSE